MYKNFCIHWLRGCRENAPSKNPRQGPVEDCNENAVLVSQSKVERDVGHSDDEQSETQRRGSGWWGSRTRSAHHYVSMSLDDPGC